MGGDWGIGSGKGPCGDLAGPATCRSIPESFRRAIPWPLAAANLGNGNDMFIPSYQIHNILKDFTRRLKKIRQHPRSPAVSGTTSPASGRSAHDLRQSAVASQVAENIMARITDLGKEARHSPPAESRAPLRGFSERPPVFDYHLLDRQKGKVKHRLVVEDSRILVQRFQQMTNTEPSRRK